MSLPPEPTTSAKGSPTIAQSSTADLSEQHKSWTGYGPSVVGRFLLRIARVSLIVAAIPVANALAPGTTLFSVIVVTAAFFAMYVAVPKKVGNARLWTVYVVGFVVFALVRQFADETGVAVRYAYVIAADQALFHGVIPTVWLQAQLYTPGQVGFIDAAALVVYTSFFLAPHLIAVSLVSFSPEKSRRFIAAMLGTYYVGLGIYFLVPTAPPWIAGQSNYLPHVAQIVVDITKGVSETAYETGYAVVGPNDVAAMPSLHTAITWVISLAAWRTRPLIRWLGVFYGLLMGTSLVYLGEHYVVDVLVGILIATGVWILIGRWDLVNSGSASVQESASQRGGQHVLSEN